MAISIAERDIQKALREATTTRTVRHDVEIKTPYNRNRTSITPHFQNPFHKAGFIDGHANGYCFDERDAMSEAR